MSLTIEVRRATRDEEARARACLTEHAREAGVAPTRGTMWDDDEPFAVVAISGNRAIGGLIGKIYWNWLDAELVWVEAAFRRAGVGRAVMRKAEQTARGRGLTGICLWTASWQAPGFYRKLGFAQFAEFDDFPPGNKRFGFRKYLSLGSEGRDDPQQG
jgi:GNAT superfamily N-acetyltransferase